MNKTALYYVVPLIYLALSYPIFLMVYKTSIEVIDEKFHLNQGKHFCMGNFEVWDKKITTFPGLYILSALVLPTTACTTFFLRTISLFSSTLNVYLIIKIKEILSGKHLLSFFEAINLAILPPIYFFAHLYYTDAISTTAVLGFYYYWLKCCHGKAAVFGFFSVLMRQTNIVWTAMCLGISVLQIIKNEVKKLKSRSQNKTDFKSIFQMVVQILYSPDLLKQLIRKLLTDFWGYMVLLCTFSLFVFYNGSIVLGDKSAHVATLHITQIFYFSLFVLFFGICFILPISFEALNYLQKRPKTTLAYIIFGLLIVKYNTLVHPYLLADNRHYTFYIWNRFYGKFDLFKYLMVPVYIFAIKTIQISLRKTSIEFKAMYFLSLFIVLCLQSLLEVRYFILPFLILRLNINLKPSILALEFIYYVIINFSAFYIFFTKEIHWDNFENIQRLIW